MITTTATSTVGSPFTGVTVDLERGKILEFAEATHSTHAAYRDAERPVVPPTYLCGTDSIAGAHDVPSERDCRFFGAPPRAGDQLTVTVRDGEHDRITEYRDADGRLIADAWTQGAGGDTAVVGQLANYATDWLGPESVRRFRTRLVTAVAADETLSCSGEVVQEYTADGEARVDVVLTATGQGGRVAARAWATFARAA
ncbi:FAS1-like dehydratase domain-containing protein [Rhodococcus maanshanensis]|uniref:N-terminal half of MaoC dehydratase n=1 Tax=Rhodococcus maanshanensis TaxID=183556 RepID=A0A1H7WRV1_9NOCA|nr:MaoC family dehydratase N-terminal domain-containing protein [Rhodococcus maanshanensis]SEM23965.1 N-terminal half of MaoC dehydratase [Rhodococcus maanshanensis]